MDFSIIKRDAFYDVEMDVNVNTDDEGTSHNQVTVKDYQNISGPATEYASILSSSMWRGSRYSQNFYRDQR